MLDSKEPVLGNESLKGNHLGKGLDAPGNQKGMVFFGSLQFSLPENQQVFVYVFMRFNPRERARGNKQQTDRIPTQKQKVREKLAEDEIR